MSNPTYSLWLVNEVLTAENALLELISKCDQLRYIDAPALKQVYMVKIGLFEEKVLNSELKASLLQRKLELIQTAINQQQHIDIEQIEKQLQEEQQNNLIELEKNDITMLKSAMLSEEEKIELQQKYHCIIERFHPQLNSDISDTQKDLFQKALDAYKKQNIEALRVIYDMLFGVMDSLSAIEQPRNSENDASSLTQDFIDAIKVDYSLAQKLYSCFQETEDDAILISKLNHFMERKNELEEELQGILNSFPFSAKATLDNPELTEDYLLELRLRLKQSEDEINKLTIEIGKMLGEI